MPAACCLASSVVEGAKFGVAVGQRTVAASVWSPLVCGWVSWFPRSVFSRCSERVAAGTERRCAAAFKMLRSAISARSSLATAPSTRSENMPCGAWWRRRVAKAAGMRVGKALLDGRFFTNIQGTCKRSFAGVAEQPGASGEGRRHSGRAGGPGPGNAPFARVFGAVLGRLWRERRPKIGLTPPGGVVCSGQGHGARSYRALVGVAPIGLSRENRLDSHHVR